ncbi:MAG: hypothetical protein NVV70_16770 [Cellulomonas sp.]|nr:hypothetical protein [Cellulomonas sp.]MCR6649699.1 hypothetical protein [Cellulomonas sp.]
MSVGTSYQAKAARAVVGPARSSLFPAILHIGWLDASGDLIAMSGRTVAQSAFAPVTGGVANVTTIDAGVAGSGWSIKGIGLFDAATGGELVLSAQSDTTVSPTSGQSLTIPAGALVFTVDA